MLKAKSVKGGEEAGNIRRVLNSLSPARHFKERRCIPLLRGIGDIGDLSWIGEREKRERERERERERGVVHEGREMSDGDSAECEASRGRGRRLRSEKRVDLRP